MTRVKKLEAIRMMFRDWPHTKRYYAGSTLRKWRSRGKINSCGIITVKLCRSPKRRFGFQNGDIVRAVVSKGKYQGTHVGRVMTRKSGYFDVRKTGGSIITANYRNCVSLQKDNGFLCFWARENEAIPLGY